MAKRGETPTTQHPARELLNLYYSFKPETIIDVETGESTVDWDGYYLRVRTLINTLSAEHQTEFVEMITKNMTPIEQMRYQVSSEYFQPYNARYRAVLSTFTEPEQALIEEYYHASPDRRAAIREITREGSDLKLISQYTSTLRLAGENLRKMSPELDAWMRVFGKTSTCLTEPAEVLYSQYCSELGVPE
jgi:hypothetical protein